MSATGVTPVLFRRWSRGLRLTVFAIAIVITGIIVIPACIMALGYLVGFSACDRPETASSSVICSPMGRLLFAVVGIAVAVPLARKWGIFLARTLGVIDTELAPDEGARQVSPRFARTAIELPSWQKLLSGTIERCGSSDRTVLFEGITLTFWSLYPLQKGRLKEGDRTVIVFQRTPLTGTNFALAFVDGRSRSVRSVAPRVQIAAALIAIACIALFAWFKPPLAGFWITICCMSLCVSVLYLMLMLRARGALRNFLDSSGSSPA